MSNDVEVLRIRRRRGDVLKMIRQGHEEQQSRMDDFEVWSWMQDMGFQVGPKQTVTMLQDLAVLGYIQFKQGFDNREERTRLREIELTAAGTALVIRRQSNDEVLFG